MTPIDFPGVNKYIGKDQPEYQTLPAIYLADNVGTVITCWELSVEEIEELIRTRKIYISIWTGNEPLSPMKPSTDLSELL